MGQKLRALLELDENWDDDHAPAPTVIAVEGVRDFAAELEDADLSKFAVCPTHEGGVLVETQSDGERWSLEVEPAGGAVVIISPIEGAPLISEVLSPEDAAAALKGSAL